MHCLRKIMSEDHRMEAQKYLIIAYNVFANTVLLKSVVLGCVCYQLFLALHKFLACFKVGVEKQFMRLSNEIGENYLNTI
jgi:hypothetical protein